MCALADTISFLMGSSVKGVNIREDWRSDEWRVCNDSKVPSGRFSAPERCDDTGAIGALAGRGEEQDRHIQDCEGRSIR